MRKFVLLFVGLILALNIIFPGTTQAQVDSTKLFVCVSGFGVFPSDASSERKANGGLQFEGHYRITDRTSGMVSFKNWYVKGLNDGNGNTTGQKTTYLAGAGAIWAYEQGSRYNVGFTGEYGQATIGSDEEENKKNGFIYGAIFKATIWRTLSGVLTLRIGEFEGSKDDVLMIGLGVGAPISFGKVKL